MTLRVGILKVVRGAQTIPPTRDEARALPRALHHAIGALFAVGFAALQGCTIGPPPPPAVSPAVIKSGAQHATNVDQLNAGRSLFVRRCTQCHVLPKITAHSADEWPGWVAKMGHRAHLTAQEREAVLAYLMAASER